MSARVLIAGVGNVFLGDDGFGVEVARRLLLSPVPLPQGVVVSDFGIRGIHLAFELLDPPDLLIVADATRRGEPPGTVYVLEAETDGAPVADAHGMDVSAVFAQARAMGAVLPRVLLVGCEPADLREHMGLSPAVEAAVETAAATIRDLAARALDARAPENPQEDLR
jgi:hydrogenase maturation protease